MKTSTVTVLLVEDNPIDREAMRRGFAKQRIANPIVEAVDGYAALATLRGTNGHARSDRTFCSSISTCRG